jgi:hypothetical protein
VLYRRVRLAAYAVDVSTVKSFQYIYISHFKKLAVTLRTVRIIFIFRGLDADAEKEVLHCGNT